MLFECRHGRYWYLGDRMLPQIEHEYPPTIILIHPCHTIRLVDFLANEKVARACNGYIVAGIEGSYFEFIQLHLQGCLVGKMVFFFHLKSNFLSRKFLFIFLLSNNTCMLHFQSPSSKGEEGGEGEEEIPSPHHGLF